jgi:hypothetical protein
MLLIFINKDSRRMYNVIKFQAPFERIKLNCPIPEANLIRAIITQAVIDASNVSDVPSIKKQTLDARNWIFGGEGHEDFVEMCLAIGLEPSFIARFTKEAIKDHQKKCKQIKATHQRNIEAKQSQNSKFIETQKLVKHLHKSQ